MELAGHRRSAEGGTQQAERAGIGRAAGDGQVLGFPARGMCAAATGADLGVKRYVPPTCRVSCGGTLCTGVPGPAKKGEESWFLGPARRTLTKEEVDGISQNAQ